MAHSLHSAASVHFELSVVVAVDSVVAWSAVDSAAAAVEGSLGKRKRGLLLNSQ